MTSSRSVWIKEAQKQEVKLGGRSIKKEAEEALKEINANVEKMENGQKDYNQKENGKEMENNKTLNEGEVRKL